MGDGPVAFYGKNQGEDDEERTNDDLCVGPPVGSARHDDTDLIFHDKSKGTDGDEEHETHGEEEHFIVLSCVAEPCGDSKEADGGKKLVSRAEESPDPPMPRDMPRITVRIVAKYGFTMSLRNPSLTSFGFSPGSSQNSWNMKRASLVAVSREVKQKAE